MTTNLEQAFPLNANWPAATVRAKLAEAMIAVFDTANLSGEDFSIQPYPAIAVYGPDGDLTLYAYDATDTTTADDGGISCIVVSGRRYKRSGEMAVRDAAISATTATQPVSPSLGDTYIVPAAPSGDDWASKAKTVATFSARGWIFRQPFVGMIVYVEDEDAIYHYDSGGSWVKGLPIGAIQDGSIPPKKLAHPFAILKVEDQRNDPPGSAPTVGTMYQVGTSPTGDFVGHTSAVARWNESASWEFIAPAEGDTIYRKDAGTIYTYRSGLWEPTIPAAGVQQIKKFGETSSQISVPAGSGNNNVPFFFDNGITLQSDPSKFLRISIIRLVLSQTAPTSYGTGRFFLLLLRDTESADIGLNRDLNPTVGTSTHTVPDQVLLIPVIDSAPHQYRLAVVRVNTSTVGYDATITEAKILIEELAIIP